MLHLGFESAKVKLKAYHVLNKYYKIAKVAGRLAPGDLGLRSFYFVEFLLDPNLLEIIPSHDDHDA